MPGRRRSAPGKPAITGVTAAATAAADLPSGSGTSIVNRVVRSTRVPICDLPARPSIRSPSQCPGTARSAAPAGRWLMFTISFRCPRPSAPAARRGLRICRSVRR